MKIIHPNKVTGQLLDIIYEAEKELVIVSPYVNFSYWQKPVAAIKQAIARGVKVDFYIRNDYGRDTGQSHVEKLGITPILVENLHAKIYYNENDGIITSMNLLHSSDSNSIEIGSQTETPAELAELRRIVQQFLAHYKSPSAPMPDSALMPPNVQNEPFEDVLGMHLFHTLDPDSYVEWENDDTLNISALRNAFTLCVTPPSNKIVLEGIISRREAERYDTHRLRHFKDAKMLYKLVSGNDENRYTRIRGTYTRFLTTLNLDQLPKQEVENLLTVTTDFIRAVHAFKDDYN